MRLASPPPSTTATAGGPRPLITNTWRKRRPAAALPPAQTNASAHAAVAPAEHEPRDEQQEPQPQTRTHQPGPCELPFGQNALEHCSGTIERKGAATVPNRRPAYRILAALPVLALARRVEHRGNERLRIVTHGGGGGA